MANISESCFEKETKRNQETCSCGVGNLMAIDHEYTEKIVCPYCGHKFINSFEYSESEEDVPCQSCDKKFDLSVDVEIYYTTSKRYDWKGNVC